MGSDFDGRGYRWRGSGADMGQDASSAWGYAITAGAGYTTAAVMVSFLAIWLAVGLALPGDGVLVSLFVALLLFVVGTVTWVLIPVILVLSMLMAWLVGWGMTVDERRQRIDANRAADAAQTRAWLAAQPARKQSGNGGWLVAFIAGALLGWFWGDDD